MAFWTLALEIFIFIRFYGWNTMGEIAIVVKLPESPFELSLVAGLAGLGIGFLTGVFEILLVPKNLSHRSFGEVVGVKAIVYVAAILAMVFVVLMIDGVGFQNLLVADALEASVQFFFSLTFLPILIYGTFISVLLGVLLQVNKKFGPGILWNLFVGKYHRPKEEDRIFMFLDLTASTTIAEKLGHVRYSRLIQDCFQDLSDILLDYQANIYQFVGDEAVLTWARESGLNNGNCIRIYYAFERQLKNREKQYLEYYDHFPKFKASLNIGKVSVAEVGDIKSEIAYHGDVLNTAARILEQCNIQHRGLLISGALEAKLDNTGMSTELMTSIQLRGKDEEVQIFGVDFDGE